jgi:hypothetical protein
MKRLGGDRLYSALRQGLGCSQGTVVNIIGSMGGGGVFKRRESR